MQPFIHKASVHLATKSLPSSVNPGDAVGLRLEEDGAVTALLALPSRLPFGLGRPREFAAGKLGQKASELLKPALERHAHLRVRVVEIEPAHLSHNGRSRLYISVWGDPKLVAPERPQHSIFSSSRIHDQPNVRRDNSPEWEMLCLANKRVAVRLLA